MDILNYGTPFGLAFASGLNAYLPLLAYSISVRWLHLYKINPHLAFLTQNWCIALLVVLTILDFVADKIPLIDHVWDAIHTVIRPIAGALVAAAAGSQYIPGITLMGLHIAGIAGLAFASMSTVTGSTVLSATGFVLLIIILIGGGLALLSHVAKSTTRVLSTITSLGFLNIGLSFIEDVLVVIFILLSLFASAVMLVLLVLLILILVPRLIGLRKRWYNRD